MIGIDSKEKFKDKFFGVGHVNGNATKTLPTAGIYQYKGHAFTGDSQGDLTTTLTLPPTQGKGHLV